MKSRRNHRRRMARCLHADEIAERPPEKRKSAELARVLTLIESLPSQRNEGRPA
jgi:hypothetical protein